jgi:hypothetical protein
MFQRVVTLQACDTASKAAIFSAQRAAQNKPAKYDMACESQDTKNYRTLRRSADGRRR